MINFENQSMCEHFVRLSVFKENILFIGYVLKDKFSSMDNSGAEALRIGGDHCQLLNLLIWDHKNSILDTCKYCSEFERKRNIYSITWG